jgi:predicted alpha/beta-fold hydrolase
MGTSSISFVSMPHQDGRTSSSCTDSREPRVRITHAGCCSKPLNVGGLLTCCCSVAAAASRIAHPDSIIPVARRLFAIDAASPFLFVGVSLGGNVLLKWLGECGESVDRRVAAAAAVSVPFDLARASRHIDRGFSRVYQRHFLQSLRRKALAKLKQYPDLVSRKRVRSARTLYEFDDIVTAPVHGFADAGDYYAHSSSIRFLSRIRVATLLLNAVDDPFLPSEVLEQVRGVASGNPYLEVEFLAKGGHVGFVSGQNPFRPFYYAEWRVGEFLERATSVSYGAPIAASP